MHDCSLTTIPCIFSIYKSHDFLIKSTSLHGIKYFDLHKACHIALKTLVVTIYSVKTLKNS